MKRILFLMTACGVVLLLFFSCQSKNSFQGETLVVDLELTTPKVYELFFKIEVVPLETQDNCLLMEVEKIVPYRDSLYVYDSLRPALYVFEKGGNFVRQIGRKGNGPGEYVLFYDFGIDDTNLQIYLLDPLGFFLIYDMNGQFLQKRRLSFKSVYQSFEFMPDGNMAFWSCIEPNDGNSITIVDKNNRFVNDYWKNDRMLDLMLLYPFHTYHGKTFFSTAFQHVVYEVMPEVLKPVYRWDFGDRGVSQKKLETFTQIANPSAKNDAILQALDDGSLPFVMERHSQTDKYYYVALRPGFGPGRDWINVLYAKENGQAHVFRQVEEGFSIRPYAITDEYILSLLSYEEIGLMESVLSGEEYAKIASMNEEDNMCLLRCYFK